MANSNKRLEKVETEVQSLSTHMKSIDNQISPIAQAVSNQHIPGQFPWQPKVNPKDCKTIHLRSGTSYESPPMPETAAEQGKKVRTEPERKEEPERPPTSPEPMEVKIPFPQVVQRKSWMRNFQNFWIFSRKCTSTYPSLRLFNKCRSISSF
ncbi:hypothetical protein AAHA92_00055 [Salvia divinorum]|uniref:Uncharacterized protein n=1 Tax=Salvia divinorum TaxID=28513 RepID=A0ABD1IIA9_SALDI